MEKKGKRIVVWGTGYYGKKFSGLMKKYYQNYNYEILGYTNSYNENSGELVPFLKQETINDGSICFDYIIIAVHRYVMQEINDYLTNSMGIDKDKVIYWETFVNMLRRDRILQRNKNDKQIDDPQIIGWLINNELTVRNNYENREKIKYQVYIDEENKFPYVMFHGHRMYYPKDTRFIYDNDGKRCLYNIVETDQYENSPHLYITREHRINKGDVIVDGGVAEGNFFLSHIDDISKAYLFEGDKRWLEALEFTIKPFKEKVVIIPKYLSDIDNETYTTLDSSISGKVDFIKLDIEGYETRALLGGMNTLINNTARLSVCSYHRRYDEKYIGFLLRAYGYKVSTSSGYMFFMYDDDIDVSLDFRRGVIYGDKEI